MKSVANLCVTNHASYYTSEISEKPVRRNKFVYNILYECATHMHLLYLEMQTSMFLTSCCGMFVYIFFLCFAILFNCRSIKIFSVTRPCPNYSVPLLYVKCPVINLIDSASVNLLHTQCTDFMYMYNYIT